MNDLTNLPYIGKVLAKNLSTTGIYNYDNLKDKGTERTILELLTVLDSCVCINMIYAIEGAIQGIRWHGLAAERKKELKEFFNTNNI